MVGRIIINMDDNEEGTEIQICDNGVGIPQSEIENIFKEFYRGTNIRHKGYEGVGLGLSVVKQIMNRHGGTISVKSPSGIGDSVHPGTCFYN